MRILWYVDDLRLSHKDPFKVTNFYQYLSKIYGNKLKLYIGNIHDYPGMDFFFRDRGSKRFDDKIPTKGPRRFYRIVEGDVGHPGGRTSVPSKRGRRGGVFRGI